MSTIEARRKSRSAQPTKATPKGARRAALAAQKLRNEVEARCRKAAGFTIQLQCRDFGIKKWSVLRTLTAATKKEKIKMYELLRLQRDRWAISGVLGEQQFRIQFI